LARRLDRSISLVCAGREGSLIPALDDAYCAAALLRQGEALVRAAGATVSLRESAKIARNAASVFAGTYEAFDQSMSAAGLRRIANCREHRTFSGKVGGVALTCCSTGAGGGSTASALEELAVLGGETYIRVGTTAALQPEIECGDIVISSGAMRHDGTSQYYVDPAYPAVAHYAVTAALVEAAERLGLRYHVGVSCSTASFYCGQGRLGFNGYEQAFFRDKVDDLRRAGVLNFE